MSVVARAAIATDVLAWLELVPEAEPLFGPMSAFEGPLRRGVERGTAIVATDQVDVLGGALVSRDGQPHEINWLYIRNSRRREGAGAALMENILSRWPSGDIKVVTFTEDTPGGRPARRLYERFGFVCRGMTDLAPHGAPRDLFVLHR